MAFQRIQIRRGTALQWSGSNPVLLQGEMGLATDSGVVKIGDGVSAWNVLPALGGGGGTSDHGALSGLLDDDHTQYAQKASNLSDLASAPTARTNLGLGTAATVNTGTGATNAILGNDARLTDARTPTAHVHAAGDVTTGTMATARLGSGTANSTTFLRGDQTWAVPAGAMSAATFSATATWRAPYGQNNGNIQYAADTLNLWPVIVPRALTLTGLSLAVKTAAVGGTTSAYVCVYADDGSFAPGSLTKATAALDVSTTGVKGETFTGVALAAGLYWMGILSRGTTAAQFEAVADGATSRNPFLVMSYGTGALPNVSTGNDGTIAQQTAVTTPPATFAGTIAGDSNNKKPGWLSLKVNR